MDEIEFREKLIKQARRIADALEAMLVANEPQALDDSGGTIPPTPPGVGG